MFEFFVVFVSSEPSLLDPMLRTSVGQIVLSDNFFYWNHLSNFPLPSLSPSVEQFHINTPPPNSTDNTELLVRPVFYVILCYLVTIFVPNFSFSSSKEITSDSLSAHEENDNSQNQKETLQKNLNDFSLISLQQQKIEIFPNNSYKQHNLQMQNLWNDYTDNISLNQENFSLTIIPNINSTIFSSNLEPIDFIPSKSSTSHDKRQIYSNFSIFGEENWY